MTINPGVGNTNAYLGSCRPYLTGGTIVSGSSSEIHIIFPYVARTITIVNSSEPDIFIHFASRSNNSVIDNKHYFPLHNRGDSISFDIRSKDIYISYGLDGSSDAVFALVAELTTIPSNEISEWSGEGVDD